MGTSKAGLPLVKDPTTDNITEQVIRVNSQGPDPRFTYIMERLICHLHDFARETRLSTKEWKAGLEYLTTVGQKCTDSRQVLDSSCDSILLLMFPLGVHITLGHTRSIRSY